MTTDDRLDGNAIGGLLIDIFGREMTAEKGACGECGLVGPMGTLIAYRSAAGDVVRCPSCEAVLFVAVVMPDGLRLTLEALRWVEIRLGHGPQLGV